MAENNSFFGNKALLLSRVSTSKQHYEEFSPQQIDLEAWAKDQGYTEIVHIESVESGFIDFDSKKGWNAIITFLDEHKDFRTIIATEINRIARDESVLMRVKKYLVDNKIQLIIKDLGFYLLTPTGDKSFGADLVFHIYTSMAAFEMSDKKERQQRALRGYRANGLSIGGKELFGYDRKEVTLKNGKKKKSYDANEEKKEQIKKVFEWYAYGINGDLSITSLDKLTLECIQAGFDKYLHSRRNVNKCLKEEAYTGRKITHNRKKNPQYWNYHDKSAPKYIYANSYECIYPQIIDLDLFNKVQERLSKKNAHNRAVSNNKYVDISHKHVTLLSKIIVCPICGHFLVGDYRLKDGLNKHTYRCAISRRSKDKCPYRKAPSMLCLDSAVWSFLKTKVAEINAKKNAQYAAISKEEIENRIKNLKEQRKSLTNDYDAASTVFYQMSRRNMDNAKINYEKRLKEIDTKDNNIKKQISSNIRLLTELRERETAKQREKDLELNISKIANDKSEMYKYIHLLIKSVKPLMTTRRYTVLEVVTFDNVDEVFDYGKEDSQGLPTIKGEKHDNLYYICLDKHDNHRIKSRLINDNLAFFDVAGEYFYVSGSDRHFTLEDIFSLPTNNEEAYPNIHELWHGLEILDYQPLSQQIYEDDMSHRNITDEELERMASGENE